MTDLAVYQRNLEPFEAGVRIPATTRTAAMIFATPGSRVELTGPTALALTETDLLLCDHRGPFFGLSLTQIEDVNAVELPGVSFPVYFSEGLVKEVNPLHKFAVEITYRTPYILKERLRVYVMFAPRAYEWVAAISDAVYNAYNKLDGGSQLRHFPPP